MSNRTSRPWIGLALWLIVLAAAWPELGLPGLLNTRGGGDSPFLLQRLQQLETAVLDGHFPVRWMPDANYGFGYPFYNFYAPLSIYITLLFRLIGFSFVRSIHLSHLLGYGVAAWGTFLLVRRWLGAERPGSAWAGVLAAAAYTLAPFHLVNVYVRGDSLAEFWAMAFYPLVVLAADRLFMGGRRNLAFFGLAYAGLILSHNISALIFSPFLLLYLLLCWFSTRARAKPDASGNMVRLVALTVPLATLFWGLLLALALAAWFFVPALAERSLAQLEAVTSGYFHYSNHFLGTAVQPLVQPTFFVDYSVVNRAAFRLGLVQTAVSGGGLLALLWLWRQRGRTILTPAAYIWLTILISGLMLTPLSAWLWENLPLLAFTQFPWRFLSVLSFAGALAAGTLAAVLPGPRWWAPPLVILLLVSSLGRLKVDHLPLADAGITAESLAQYEWFTGNIGTTVSFEYLPPAVQPRPYTSTWLNDGRRWPVSALTGRLQSASLQSQGAARQKWLVETAAPSRLVFPTLYWPGWEAEVDGAAVAIRPSAGAGLIELDVAAGRHEIVLRLVRTPVRLLAEWISLAAVLLTIWLLQPSRRWLGRNVWLTLVGVLLLAAGLRLGPALLPQSASDARLYTWDFAQMGYLHPDRDGIVFSSGAVLSDYEMPQIVLQPGEPFRLVLYWQVPPAEEVTLALFSPAIHWTTNPGLPPPPPLAAQTVPGGAAQMTFALTVPANAPAGLFVPRLVLANGRPLTDSGRSRGPLFLPPVRIEPGEPAAEPATRLTVQVIDARQSAPERLEVRLAWFTPQPLSHNYNVALRLTDAEGRFLRLVDVQPGYGFLPSSGWPAGRWVNDWLVLPLPPPEEGHARPFGLVAQLYDVAEPETAVLTRRLGELVLTEGELAFRPTRPEFDLPEEIVPETAVFGEEIELRGYTVTQSEETVDITLVWQALADGQTDYTRFVHLVDPLSGGAPLAQDDSPPRYGSYPTSQWRQNEVVVERLSLPLAGVPPGSYRLAVGFYSQPAPGQFDRLPVRDALGQPRPDGRFDLPVTVRKLP